MTSLYTANAALINGKTFYIVKNYQTFPEYLDVPPVLIKYGMHIIFNEACKIAMIYDKEIQQQLLNEWEKKSAAAKGSSQPGVAEFYYSRNQPAFFPILNLAGNTAASL